MIEIYKNISENKKHNINQTVLFYNYAWSTTIDCLKYFEKNTKRRRRVRIFFVAVAFEMKSSKKIL